MDAQLHTNNNTTQLVTDEVIRCEKLTKRYHAGDILGVDQLDLAVHHGEIFGLLGPNGA